MKSLSLVNKLENLRCENNPLIIEYTFYFYLSVFIIFIISIYFNDLMRTQQRENQKGGKKEDNSDENANVLDEKVCF